MLSRDSSRANGTNAFLWRPEEPVYDLTFDLGSLSFPPEHGRLSERARGRELLSELRGKVEVIAELERVIETATMETGAFEIRKRLNEVWSRAAANADPRTLAGYEALQQIRKALRDYDSPALAPDPAFDRAAARERVQELLSDRGVDFLDSLHRATKGLIRKNDYAHNVTENRRVLHRDLFDTAGIQRDAIVDVRVRPFAVDVTIDIDRVPESERRELLEYGTLGEHYDGADFNLSYDRSAAREEEIFAHEQVHNLLDGLRAFRGRIPEDGYGKKLERMIRKISAGDAEARERLQKFSARGLVDLCHEEILAEFHIAEPKLGWLSAGWRAKSFEECEWRAVNHRPHMSTAGIAVRDAADAFRKAADSLGDPDLSGFCDGIAEIVIDVFNDRIERLRCASFVARHLGEEAVRETRALAVLLRPGQWRHIGSYLADRHGSERFSELAELYDLLHRGALDREGLQTVRAFAGELDAREKACLADRVRQTVVFLGQEDANNGEILTAMGAAEPEGAIETRRLLAEIGELAGCRKEAGEASFLISLRESGVSEGKEVLAPWRRLRMRIARLVEKAGCLFD